MPFIATPGQLSRHAELYYQLAQYTTSGIGVTAAVYHLQQNPPSRSHRNALRKVSERLAAGSTFTESIASVEGWLPDFDRALIGAGELSGRLDESFRKLATYYQERAAMLRDMISGVVYPAVLMHAAVFLLPFADFFISGDLFRYLRQTVGVLLPIYLIVAAGIWAGQSRHGETWRAILEQFLRLVPGLGSGRKSIALARLAGSLEALLSAGVNIVEAWKLSARACGSPALSRAIQGWGPALESGSTPGELVAQSRLFPELFASQYQTGEISGTLEQNLLRLQRYYHEEGSRRIRATAQWVPRIFYFAVVLIIAYRVVSFWSGYFQQIQSIGNF